MAGFKNVQQCGKGYIAWNNPAFRVVLDQRGNRLVCGSLAQCLEYMQHWEQCYQ